MARASLYMAIIVVVPSSEEPSTEERIVVPSTVVPSTMVPMVVDKPERAGDAPRNPVIKTSDK